MDNHQKPMDNNLKPKNSDQKPIGNAPVMKKSLFAIAKDPMAPRDV